MLDTAHNNDQSPVIAQQSNAQPRTYRDYPIELKAAVIAAIEQNGGNVLATSKLFNIPQTTAYEWWRNSERFNDVRNASTLSLADKLENLAASQVDSLAADDLSKVSHADKARAMSVVIDKMQLLRGQPTAITAELQRQELTIVLRSSLAGGLDLDDASDITPSVGDPST